MSVAFYVGAKIGLFFICGGWIVIGVGPFSIKLVLLALVLLLAWFIARFLAQHPKNDKRKAAGGLLLDAVFWGFVAARVAHIIQWRDEYFQKPLSMLAVSDGGYLWWAGLPVAIVYVLLRTRKIRIVRQPVLMGLAAGMLIWFAANHWLGMMQRSSILFPDEVQLTNLDQQPVALDLYRGKPVVLNLWASWCPPCRREMPAFEQAQDQFPDIAFVMVNQGESLKHVQDFLQAEQLMLNNVLLDPASGVMHQVRARGLPTTLFFDAQRQLQGVHMGEITAAGLKSKMALYFD